jgi:hypothetical protein
LERYAEKEVVSIWFCDSPDFDSTTRSGVPMMDLTNLKLVENVLGLLSVFETTTRRPSRITPAPDEKSIWNRAGKQKSIPLLWHIQPFYPHKQESISIPRTLSERDYSVDANYIFSVIKVFKPQKIFATSERVFKILKSLGIASKKLAIK